MALIGREDAVRTVAALLESLGGALVLRGERGSGRTAVLEHAHACAHALGYAVLRELPTSAERDRLRAGVAVLETLTRAAEHRPVVLLIDDADGLDAEQLAFIGRRLAGTPLALVTTATTALADTGLPEVALTRLGRDEARAVLPELPERLSTAVLATADGLPLALVELGAAARAAADALLAQPTIRLPVSARLSEVLRACLVGLAPPTRTLLLAATLDPEASLEEVLAAAGVAWRAEDDRRGAAVGPGEMRAAGAARPDDDARPSLGAAHDADTPPVDVRAALGAALDAGAVRLQDGRLRFVSPLTELAVVATAVPGAAEGVHAAFAAHADDPHRRALHQTTIATAPDAALADAVADAALERRRNGRPAAAVAAYEAAARVSTSSGVKVERLLGASLAALELGYPHLVRRLLDEAERLGPPAALAPLVEWQRRLLVGEWPMADEAESVRLVDALVAGPDADAALSALMPLAMGCWWADPSPRIRHAMREGAARLARRTADPRADAIAALADPSQAAPSLLARIAAPRAEDLADPLDAVHLAIAAQALGAWRTSQRLIGPAVERLREQDRPGALAQATVHQAHAAYYTGDWALAVSLGADARGLAAGASRPRLAFAGQLTHARALAMIGDAQQALAEAQTLAAHSGLAGADAVLRSARAGIAIAAGHAEAAVAELEPILTGTPQAMVRAGWEIFDLVEALVALNRSDTAAVRLAEFEPHALAPPGGLTEAAITCAGALIADTHETALATNLSAWPFLRARTLLAFGGSLRRAKRTAEAADALRAARDELTMLGAIRFTERAQRELRAVGERAPAASLQELTPHERRIAQLAASGLTNPEIARRLDVSPRTIGSHLYRIFPKLGITSRAQLASTLTEDA